jgi:hypothetical protein
MSFTTYLMREGVYCTTNGPAPPGFIDSWPVPDIVAQEIEDGAMLEVAGDGTLYVDDAEVIV